jgi:Mn2+/Fe2+ NRAMP family transporter
MIVGLVIALAVLLTGVDPVAVTEYSVVFSAIALPLTYIPILIVSNDPDYMGGNVNTPAVNALALVYLVVIVVAALAAIPLMIISGAGA